MPSPCFLDIEGSVQGPIQGPKSDVHDGRIAVYSVDHRFHRPGHVSAALDQDIAQFKRQQMVVTKSLDGASPRLAQAVATGEVLKRVSLGYYRPTAAGKGELYYTVTLEDAFIHEIRHWSPSPGDEESEGLGHMEDVTFVYGRIRWRDEIAGVETADQGLGTRGA